MIRIILLLSFLFSKALATGATLHAERLAFVDSPTSCLARNIYPCSVRSLQGSLRLERAKAVVVLGPGSALQFHAANEAQLLTGKAWIEKSEGMDLRVSSKLKISLSGEFFVIKDLEKITLQNLQGEAHFKSPLVFANESLPVGFENWYGRITTGGTIERGMIRPLSLTPFLKNWIPLSGLSIHYTGVGRGGLGEGWANLSGRIGSGRVGGHQDLRDGGIRRGDSAGCVFDQG